MGEEQTEEERVDLPVMPPVRPMLAKTAPSVPREPGLSYEPKWDGFRCVVFRDGDEIELGSRNDRPLTRYFPEVAELLMQALPEKCVVDGEIVVVTDQGLDFDTLQNRLHPAASRVNKLAKETPASFVAFDLLALGDKDLTGEPFAERRRLLATILDTEFARVHLTPITEDPEIAEDWFTRFEGAGFDGVMVKSNDLAYLQDKRVMLKIKHERTADCVVAGFRWHKDGEGVGSLLLGLFDDEGHLHHVGVASSFTAAKRKSLVEELKPLREHALENHPWREGRCGRAGEGRRQDAGRGEPMDRRQGPVLGGAAPGAGRRGPLRTCAVGPLAPRRPAGSLPRRPDPGIMHLRPARRGRSRRIEHPLHRNPGK